jgi:hypothetical protein
MDFMIFKIQPALERLDQNGSVAARSAAEPSLV